MGVQVKICGITSTAAAEAAVKARADFMGLICQPGSPRSLDPNQAHAIARHVFGRIRTVALLVDPGDAHVEQVLKAVRPDFLQLHGSESPERVLELRQRFGTPIIKAIPIADAGDLSHLSAYEKTADRILFDAKAPAGASRAGGHGVAFDWQILAGRSFGLRWFLAGGLNPENVGRAIRACDAPAVDASSGVETAPGVKDAEMIAQFALAARNAHYAVAQ